MPSLSPSIDAPLLDRYLSGACDAAETVCVDQWLDADPRRRTTIDLLRRELARRPETRLDVEREWARFVDRRARVGARPRVQRIAPAVAIPAASGRMWRWVALAGTAAVAGALVLGIRSRGSSSVLPAGMSAAESATYREYATGVGQRATIRLDDGTEVQLNVATRLRVPLDYGRATRTVTLDGEAQFSVTHDARRPFVVRANGSLVRDLATVFTVRAYHGSSVTSVAVREGSVSVQPATLAGATVVRSQQVAVVTENGTPDVHALGNGDTYFGWTQGRLVFEQTPLSQALVQLSRWYGMEFRTSDPSLLSADVTGSFSDTYDSNKLSLMAATLGASIERQGRVVTFVPKSFAPTPAR